MYQTSEYGTLIIEAREQTPREGVTPGTVVPACTGFGLLSHK